MTAKREGSQTAGVRERAEAPESKSQLDDTALIDGLVNMRSL